MNKLLILALFAIAPLFATEVGPIPAPTSPLTVTTSTVRITYLRMVNSGGGTSVICTLTDRTTDCGGSGCLLFKATFTADPQTVADAWVPGYLAPSGFTIVCSGPGITLTALQYVNAVP